MNDSEEKPESHFPWSVGEVEAIAERFYEKLPPHLSESERWSQAARQAVAHLIARRLACAKAVERQCQGAAAVGAARKRAEEREKLPTEWPYERAVKYITREKVWDRANKKFKLLAAHVHKGDGNAAAKDLENVRGKPMARQMVIELEQIFSSFWAHHVQSQQRAAGKRGGRPKKNLRGS